MRILECLRDEKTVALADMALTLLFDRERKVTMDEATMIDCQTCLNAELAKRNLTTIPWQAILQMLMTLLAGCIPAPTPPAAATYKALAANPGLWARFQAARLLFGIMGPGTKYADVSTGVDAAFAAVGTAQDTTVMNLAAASA